MSEIEEIAAHWIIRSDHPDFSPQDQSALQEWLDHDIRHRVAYLRIEAAWRGANRLSALRPLDDRVETDIRRLARDLGSDPAAQPDHDRRRWLAAAAAIAAASAVAWLGSSFSEWAYYETDIGGLQKVALPDGSHVQLNTDTQVRVRLTSRRRDVVLLRGEALFEVASEAERPFYVAAGGAIVRAVGTAFSVRLREDERVEVLVTEGRVAVNRRDLTLAADDGGADLPGPILAAGDAATLRDEDFVITRQQPEHLSRKLAWTRGLVSFAGETLVEAANEFNRYNRVKLVVADPEVAPLHMGGAFQATDPESFVAALRRSFGVRAQRVPGSGEGEIRLVAGRQDVP